MRLAKRDSRLAAPGSQNSLPRTEDITATVHTGARAGARAKAPPAKRDRRLWGRE